MSFTQEEIIRQKNRIKRFEAQLSKTVSPYMKRDLQKAIQRSRKVVRDYERTRQTTK